VYTTHLIQKVEQKAEEEVIYIIIIMKLFGASYLLIVSSVLFQPSRSKNSSGKEIVMVKKECG